MYLHDLLIFGHRNKRYLEYCVETDLNTLQDWFNANKLTLNVGKSVIMLFAKNQNDYRDLQVVIGDQKLPREPFARFLGMLVDDKLEWKIHLTRLFSKLNAKITLLKRSKNLLSSHAKKILYFAQFYSVPAYGICVWGTMIGEQNLAKLQKLQDTSVKQIAPNMALEEIYKEHNLLKVRDIITLEQLKLGYKLQHRLLPGPLCDQLLTYSNQRSLIKKHRYNTRQKNLPNMPKPKNEKYKKSFLCASIKQYGILEISTRHLPTLKSFVIACKNKLLAGVMKLSGVTSTLK